MALGNTLFESRMAVLKDFKTRFITFGFWATGMDFKDSYFPSDQQPKVQIGGPEDGPRFFSSVETFLGALPENYSYHLMLDQVTRITNQEDLDRLQEKFGERFRLIDIEQLGAQLIKKFPQYEEVLKDVTQNATGGMPVITSDIYRLIAMPYADKNYPNVPQKTRYLYLDIDTFVRGLSDSETLPLWLSKHYNGSNTDLNIYVPVGWWNRDFHRKPEGTGFFTPFAGDKDDRDFWNSQIAIEIPFQDQNQYATFVCHVLENLIKTNDSSGGKTNFVKIILELYKNLRAGNGMKFTGDLSQEMKLASGLSPRLFMKCILSATGPGLLLRICKSAGEKFRLFKGLPHGVCASTWVPKDEEKTFWEGYIEQAWSGRGILAIDAFLAQTQGDPLPIKK